MPEGTKFDHSVKEPGLANVGPTILNLLGFVAPPHMQHTLIA